MANETEFHYPRRVLLRRTLKTVGRAVGAMLARPHITGRENLPESGPLILVGNHIAVVEVGLMAIYTPYPVELMGAGDIPLDPRYAWVANLYGMIPIRRGSMDREGLNMALNVLSQGGVVGLFPEGGIWETSLRQARNGVAWLSSMAQAPVVPIGFGGIEGALHKMKRFKRPSIYMNIGKVIPPVNLRVPGKSRKQALSESANYIMERVSELIPEEERRIRQQNYVGETFNFHVILRTPDGREVDIPEEMQIADKRALSKLFHRPVMLDVFNRNLKLPIKPLLRVDRSHDPAEIAKALQHILDYLSGNAYFFHYRFGNEEGAAMTRGLRQLRDLANWAVSLGPGYQMQLKPIRKYTLIDTNEEVTVEVPPHVHDI